MWARLRSFISALTGRRRFEDDMHAEMAFHLDARVEDLIAGGLSRWEATRRARMEFGTVDAIADDCRQSRGLRLVDTTLQDLRYAGRLMRRAPGFTAAAIVSLGLGIGANTAIFTLFDAVMIRAVPMQDPRSLYFLAHGNGENPGTSSNYGLFERYARLTEVFDGVTAFSTSSLKLRTHAGVENVDSLWVSGNFHAVLGVPIGLGRGFAVELDRQTGGSAIAVVSDGFWARRFGRSPDVLGQPLIVNGHTVTIVGVTAPEFTGLVPGLQPDITLPLSVRVLDEPEFLDTRDTWTSMPILARLKSGVSEAQALAAADVAFKQYMSEKDNQWIAKRNPEAFAAARLMPAAKGSGVLRQRYGQPLTVLMAMVGLILLIASANVANLMLVRGEARAKEVAIRLCVGGGRRRLIRQFLTESVLLALCGGALGFFLAQWGTQAIMAFFSGLEAPVVLDVAPNARVLAFTAAVALATGVLFGLLPALKSTRIDLTPALKEGGATTIRSRRWMTGHALAASQLALGVMVIAVAALLARSLYNLKSQDVGFRGDHLLLFTLDSYGMRVDAPRRAAMYDDLLGRLRALPGVTHASASRSTPIHTSGNARALHMPGTPETMDQRSVWTNMITPGYFETFGIRLLEGRHFTDADVRGSLKVAVINEAMARFYFGDRDPLGQTFAFLSEEKDPLTVVGVVADTHQMNLREPAPKMVYTPLAQEAEAPSWITFELRTAQNPAALAPAALGAARAAAKDVVIRYVRTMDDQVNASLVRERLLASLSASFAILALVLTAVGLYGVMSYNVSRRGREIGIRMALGARRGTVLWQMLRQSLVVSAAGIVAGIAGVVLTTQYLSTLLFGLSERDPMTLTMVVLILLSTAMAASFLPARRASTMDPVRAIKTE
ncbi:MAG TPA: ABC transporter permease [Vicinamibacterales bacterium]|nr:ABC transporter permease [Vicinamibacterales bacterium]